MAHPPGPSTRRPTSATDTEEWATFPTRIDAMSEHRLRLNHGFPRMTRREMLRTSGLGLGALALSALLEEEARAAAGADLKPRAGHFRAQARAVIMLVQNGGPSQMDLFDPKPDLKKYDGKVHAEKVEMF